MTQDNEMRDYKVVQFMVVPVHTMVRAESRKEALKEAQKTVNRKNVSPTDAIMWRESQFHTAYMPQVYDFESGKLLV